MARPTEDPDSPRLPDVVGIGAEKCGTTSLHYYLRAHPEIGVQRVKETRFFALSGTWHRGVEWYMRQFPRGKRVLVESHGGGYTAYPREQGVPERIRSTVPDARLLYLVRDPIDRLVSRWVHTYSNSDEDRPIDEALLDFDDVEYVPQSLYYSQIERFLPYFPRERFLIVDHSDLLHDRRGTLRSVFASLGVDPGFWSDEFEIIRHDSSWKRRNTAVGMAIHRLVGRRIFERLHGPQRHWFKKLVYTPFSRPIPRPALRPETRARLRELFAPDVAKLEEFAGRRFATWLSD